MERRIHYLFVDLEYLLGEYRNFADRWFKSEGGIDFHALHRHAHAPHKSFYYASESHDGATGARDSAGSPRGGYFDRITSAPGTHLRTGSRAAIGIQLAVDVMQHATRGKMTHASLLSGDAAFAPLIEALVEIGTDVTVVASPTSVAESLRNAADNFLPMRWQDHHHWTNESIAAAALLPGIGSSVASKLEGSHESYKRNGWTLVASGTIGEARHRAELWEQTGAASREYSLAIEQNGGGGDERVETVSHSDRDLLLRYAEMEWGAVSLVTAAG
jgi:hypothetical protein